MHGHTHTKTHAAVVMGLDWRLSKGHGQSRAATTTSDPEKTPPTQMGSLSLSSDRPDTLARIHGCVLSADYVQVGKRIILFMVRWRPSD